MKGIIVVDVERCLGCKSCELQCAVAHSKSKDLFKAIEEVPLPQYRVTVETAGELSAPLQCRHCEGAPCVQVCATHALQKVGPGQPVMLKKELCIGCKWCILVCPFGVIGMDRAGKVIIKCDLCLERTEAGRLPACVEACSTGALSFLKLREVTQKRRREFLVDFKPQGPLVKEE